MAASQPTGATAQPSAGRSGGPSDGSSSAPVLSDLAANGIPAIALNAYRLAAKRIDKSDPTCHLSWSLLAAIGRVESDHGQFGGALLHKDGVDGPPRVIGIPLNGHGTALIRDTDHGRLDGDTVYDRAVGPMQFIPSTWAGYGADGNGDGKADPFNIYDATLAAARYLCDAGGDLSTAAARERAVRAYNDSDQYVALVLALADAYAKGIPVGNLPITGPTGPVAPVHRRPGEKPPPVNPATPPALKKVIAQQKKKAAATTGAQPGTSTPGAPGASSSQTSVPIGSTGSTPAPGSSGGGSTPPGSSDGGSTPPGSSDAGSTPPSSSDTPSSSPSTPGSSCPTPPPTSTSSASPLDAPATTPTDTPSASPLDATADAPTSTASPSPDAATC